MRRIFILKFGSEFSVRIFYVTISSSFFAQNKDESIAVVSLLRIIRIKVRKALATDDMARAR